MEFLVTPFYQEGRLSYYILQTELTIDGITDDYYPINIDNRLYNNDGRIGFSEIKREIVDGKLILNFRLNTWYPESQDLIFDKMLLTVKWDIPREDGLLTERVKKFDFKFNSKKLRKMFSGKSEEIVSKKIKI